MGLLTGGSVLPRPGAPQSPVLARQASRCLTRRHTPAKTKGVPAELRINTGELNVKKQQHLRQRNSWGREAFSEFTHFLSGFLRQK